MKTETERLRGLLVNTLSLMRLEAHLTAEEWADAREELIADTENTLGIVNDNHNVSDRRVA